MNKSLIYGVVGLVVVVVIAAAAFNMNKTSGPEGGSPAVASNMSIKDLIAKGGSQQCTFSRSDAGTESSGVIYVTGGKVRGDFTSKASGERNVESHLIVDGETAYLWTDAMPQGLKMNFNAMNDTQSGSSSGSVDVNQKVDYDCSYWSADQGKFALPSNISFMEMGALAGVAVPTGTASPQCSQCDLISDTAAKAQCRAALSCN